MSLLEIEGLTHSFGENLLYKNAGFTLNKGEHIGIVGQNGTGKSTLIKICTEQIIPDNGRIIWQPNITIGYLDQYAEIDHTLTMKEFLKSAFAKLFEIEAQAMQLYEKAADGDMKSLELAAYYQEQLETHDFYSIDSIHQIASWKYLKKLQKCSKSLIVKRRPTGCVHTATKPTIPLIGMTGWSMRLSLLPYLPMNCMSGK